MLSVKVIGYMAIASIVYLMIVIFSYAYVDATSNHEPTIERVNLDR